MIEKVVPFAEFSAEAPFEESKFPTEPKADT